jgi:hypothetical protein
MDRFEVPHRNENSIRKTQDVSESPCENCTTRVGCETCLSFQNYVDALLKQSRKEERW